MARHYATRDFFASDDWNTWDAGEMQAAVDYLRRKRGLTR